MKIIPLEFNYHEEGQFFLNIANQISNKNNFLDVGGGNGKYTIPISKLFKKTIIVDKDISHKDNYTDENTTYMCCDFTDYGGTIEYDFILCTHTLIHNDNNKFLFDKLCSLLSKMEH